MSPFHEELMSTLRLLGGLLEDLNQRIVALESVLSPQDQKKYELELKRVRARTPSTNVVLALEVLRGTIPDH
jgi:hypothetical protein